MKEVLEPNAKIVRKVCAPRNYPCPTCGKRGRRQFTLGRLREFVARFFGLLDKRLTLRQARCRRTRLVHNPLCENHPQLRKVLKMVRVEQFEKMIVHLRWKNVDSTNNHVERNNRSFWMMQKTREQGRLCKGFNLNFPCRGLPEMLTASEQCRTVRVILIPRKAMLAI